MRIPHESLVLVADGRKMLLYRNEGMADAPSLAVTYGEEQPNPADRDQKTDAAGRHPSALTHGQDSAGETDFHRQTEDRFARHIAEHLNGMALQEKLPPLFVIAPARTLGEMRKHFHALTQARIVTQIEKDVTGHPTGDIERMLVNAEEVG